MDDHHKMLVAVAANCIHQLLVSYFTIFDDVPTASEARAAKRHKRELTSYKRYLSVEYGRPTTNLEHIPHLECILQDMNRLQTTFTVNVSLIIFIACITV
jgi:hypothetical protein